MHVSALTIVAALTAVSATLAAPIRTAPGQNAYVNRSTKGARDLEEAALLLRDLPDLEARQYQ